MSGFESAAITRGRTIRENWSLGANKALPVNRRSQSSQISSEVTHHRPKPPGFPFLIQGDNFAGFTIERKLGQGGFGVVFLAESRYGKVALKISSDDLRDEAFAHALAAGRCYQGLVGSLETGTHQINHTEKYHYLAMRYVPGPTLKKILKHDVPPPDRKTGALLPERAARIMQNIALAAGEMHRAGLVHGDIKPANVVMKSREGAVLLDYGLAKQWPVPEPVDGILRGTKSYMAPEKLVGERYGPPADVFAMGVTFWEMLTGKSAVEHRKYQIGYLGQEYEPLPPLPDYIPPKYQEIINKATALYPQDRYPDGHALAQALAEI